MAPQPEPVAAASSARVRYRDALAFPQFRALFLAYSISILGSVVSAVAWVTLGRELARDGASAGITSGILGAWTGFIGAFTAWAFQTGNLFGLTTPGLDRIGAGFGFVGATLGLVYWPLIGAAVCFGAAFFSLRRRLA